MRYVRRLPRLEYPNRLRSISFTFDPIHTEYTGGSTAFSEIELVRRSHQI